MSQLLIIPKIKIQNANAVSSPYTIGFPAMTAWLGGVHALQRKLNANGYSELQFNRVGIVSHAFELQASELEYDRKLKLVKRSITSKAPKVSSIADFLNGGQPPIIPEGRCHLTVSLIIEYSHLSDRVDDEDFKKAVANQLHSGMKLASGDIINFEPLDLKSISEMDYDGEAMRKLTQTLMPSYALIERRDLMIDAMKQGQDSIDSLLNYLKIIHECKKDDETEKVTWLKPTRKAKGCWIVPIATGFQGLTDLKDHTAGQRDSTTHHRFAESIITLGEFKMIYRLETLDELLWQYKKENDLYLCTQQI
ncbi:MAG: type I-F CRISPR-associated protein Csy2 [Methylococcales bacterium]